MDANVKRFLGEMADRAAAVAQEARGAMSVAGKAVGVAGRAVGERTEAARLRLEAARLRSECEGRFTEIGRAFYLMNAGAWPGEEAGESAQHRIESLLGEVGEREMQIEEIGHRLKALSGSRRCPGCGRECEPGDAFCPGCGSRLGE